MACCREYSLGATACIQIPLKVYGHYLSSASVCVGLGKCTHVSVCECLVTVTDFKKAAEDAYAQNCLYLICRFFVVFLLFVDFLLYRVLNVLVC